MGSAHSIPRIQACSTHQDPGRVPCYQNSTRPKITVHYTPPFVVRRPREPRESNSPCTDSFVCLQDAKTQFNEMTLS